MRSTSACSSVLPPRETASLRAQPLSRFLQRGVDAAVGGVQLGGELEFDERLLVPLRRRKPPSAIEMLLRCAKAGAFQRGAGIAVVWFLPGRLGVFDDRQVVILRALRAADRPGRRWWSRTRPARTSGEQDRSRRQAAAVTALKRPS